MPRFNIMLGRTLGSATIGAVQGFVVMLLSFIFGFRVMNWPALILSLFVMFLVAMLFTSLSTMIASILKDMQGFQAVMNFLIMPLFLLSGSLFPLQGLPKALEAVTIVNPLSYGIDALRALLINQSHFGIGIDLAVLVAFTAVFLFLGGHFFKKIQI